MWRAPGGWGKHEGVAAHPPPPSYPACLNGPTLRLALTHRDELAAHVGFAPQCAFNSYLWRSSPRTWGRWLARPYTMQGGESPGGPVRSAPS